MSAVSANKTDLFTEKPKSESRMEIVRLVAADIYFNSASEHKRGIKAEVRKPALIPL